MLENLTIKQKKILVIIGIIVNIGILYFIYNKSYKSEKIDLDENILVSNNVSNVDNSEIKNSQDDKDIIVVHITGAVKNPGIVKLEEGSRIEAAIEASGGLTDDADISKVNLAYILEDGIKIRIPSSFDENIIDSDILIQDSGEDIIIQETNNSNSNSNVNININKATETELETLPGIGASLASRIIEYREQNGKFSNIEEIKNVSGIGDSKYNNIKDYICVK